MQWVLRPAGVDELLQLGPFGLGLFLRAADHERMPGTPAAARGDGRALAGSRSHRHKARQPGWSRTVKMASAVAAASSLPDSDEPACTMTGNLGRAFDVERALDLQVLAYVIERMQLGRSVDAAGRVTG